MIIYIVLLAIFIFLVLLIRFARTNISKKKISILMYHQIDLIKKDCSTITVEQFEQQLIYLIENEYEIIALKELIFFTEGGFNLPEKSVLITFDDCYSSVIRFALPVLLKYNVNAVFFIPTQFINGKEEHNNGSMSLRDLKRLINEGHEIALHSHSHQDFGIISPGEIKKDLVLNITYLKENEIPFQPAIAYPYGSRPVNKGNYNEMINIFYELGIKAAFRIGNRINKFPFKNKFEINRLDIKGSDSFKKFKLKLRWGKISL